MVVQGLGFGLGFGQGVGLSIGSGEGQDFVSWALSFNAGDLCWLKHWESGGRGRV